MMKKLIVVAVAALVAAGAQAASYKDGSYTGEGKGRESQIQVQVDVAGGKIAAVKTDTKLSRADTGIFHLLEDTDRIRNTGF